MKTETKSETRFRDYQIDAIVRVYQSLGVTPAGPPDDPICDEFDKRCEIQVPF